MHLSNNSSAKMLLKEPEMDHFTRFCVGNYMISREFGMHELIFFSKTNKPNNLGSMKNLQVLIYSKLFEKK